jgi:pseudaminic acid cytidylyltransferase
MIVAMIPARGGSKRIPRKNIKLFHGKPIIAYSIEAALKSGLFDEVIVSTDDEEIASVAKQYGAKVPFIRPEKLSDDYATTVEVIKHTLNWYSEHSKDISVICCVYATAPFIKKSVITEGYKAITEKGYQFSFVATEFPFPIQRAIKVTEQGAVSMFCPETMNTRSQDLEKSYHDVGQLYWGHAQAFLDNRPLYSPDACAVIIPASDARDIDTPEDWQFAEILYQALYLTT